MLTPVNRRFLAEPLNHPGRPACDELEDGLNASPGPVVLVTHDRYRIRSVADALLEVRDGRVTYWTEVEEHVLAPRPDAPGPASAGPPPAAAPTPGRRPNKADERRQSAAVRQAGERATKDLRKDVRRLEREVAKAEEKVASLHEQLSDPEIYDDHQKVRELADAHDAAQTEVDKLTEQWMAAQEALDAAGG